MFRYAGIIYFITGFLTGAKAQVTNDPILCNLTTPDTCPTGQCCVRDEFLFSYTYCRPFGTEGQPCSIKPSMFECHCHDGLTCISNIHDIGGYRTNSYTVNLGSQSTTHSRQGDTKMLDMSGVASGPSRRKNFDWYILSVLGCVFCAPIGVCAIYYAIRANHGYDHNIEEYKINDSSQIAKVLTILTIALGSLGVVALIIASLVMYFQ